MKSVLFLSLSLTLSSIFVACSNSDSSSERPTPKNIVTDSRDSFNKVFAPETVEIGNADTIVYNVYLKPLDASYIDAYQGFNRESFVDSIFSAVFYHKATVTDMLGKPLTIDSLKTREIEDPVAYGRDKVAGIQFKEIWYFDTARKRMNKQVLSMLIGYEVYDQDSTFIGLRPGFIISFDNKKK